MDLHPSTLALFGSNDLAEISIPSMNAVALAKEGMAMVRAQRAPFSLIYDQLLLSQFIMRPSGHISCMCACIIASYCLHHLCESSSGPAHVCDGLA